MRAGRLAILGIALTLVACGTPRYVPDPNTHIVRRGETLFSIAWRYGKDPGDVARWNGLGDGSLIHPGQTLYLEPRAGTASRPTQTASRPPTKSLPKVPTQPPPPWGWPTRGGIDVEFGGKPGTGTGVLINGKTGQAISAAASGRVVYAGSGLIGYGQLIIVKHNDTYLSAYGYNASLLVKEGEERKARLHFEIRRNGKPVNPRQYLPAR
jgi:lipoprotein NlpD